MKKSSIMFLIAAILFAVSAFFADKLFIRIIDFSAAVVFVVSIIFFERGDNDDN